MIPVYSLLISGLLSIMNPATHCPTIGTTYTEGSTWQFVLLDEKGELYKTYNYKVDEIYDEGERIVYSIKYVTLNKKGKEEDKGNRNIIAAANMYLVNAESMIPDFQSDDPVNYSLLCDPQPGASVGDVNKVSVYTVDNLGQKSYISNKIKLSGGKYGNKETISTAMGDLECIKLTYSLNLDLQEFTYTDWIDSSLRTVKREIYDKKGRLAFTGTMTAFSNN
jgi:hypothetical protein